MTIERSKDDSGRSGSARALMAWLGIALAVVCAIYVRTVYFPGALADPYRAVYDSDAARFYRLIDLIARDYPSLPMFDPFVNFPWGMASQLPPVWAFLQASFGLLLSRLTELSVAAGAALFPPLVGLFVPVPVYYFTRSLFGKRAAYTASVVSLFFPTSTIASSLGMVDHHIADLALYLSIMALLVSSHAAHSRGESRRGATLGVVAGLTLAFTLLVSLSSILVVVILAVALLGGTLVLPAGERKSASLAGLATMASAGCAMLLLLLATPWFTRDLSFSGLSLLQPLVLLGIASLLAASRAVDAGFRDRRLWRVAVLSSLYALPILIALALPEFGASVVRGFYRSIAYYPLGTTTKQLGALFENGPERVFFHLTHLAYLLPFGLLAIVRDAYTRRRLSFGEFLYAVWFTISISYAIAVRYYLPLFAPAAIVTLGFVFDRTAVSIEGIAGGYRGRRPSGARAAGGVAWLAMTVAFCAYSIFWLAPLGMTPPDADRYAMLGWIKENTPKVSGGYKPGNKPEYGILTDWSYGELVGLISERPAMATGNHENGTKGIIASIRILDSRDETEAVSLMNKYRLRYVFLDTYSDPWLGELDRLFEAGPSPERIARRATRADIARRDYMHLLNVHLYRFFGAGDRDEGVEPLQRFRLIKTTGKEPKSAYLLFEMVKGAQLVIATPPGSEVVVKTTVKPEGIPSVEWRSETEAGAEGKVEIRLPYATVGNHYPVKADTYRILVGSTEYIADATDEDVSLGKMIPLKAVF